MNYEVVLRNGFCWIIIDTIIQNIVPAIATAFLSVFVPLSSWLVFFFGKAKIIQWVTTTNSSNIFQILVNTLKLLWIIIRSISLNVIRKSRQGKLKLTLPLARVSFRSICSIPSTVSLSKIVLSIFKWSIILSISLIFTNEFVAWQKILFIFGACGSFAVKRIETSGPSPCWWF